MLHNSWVQQQVQLHTGAKTRVIPTTKESPANIFLLLWIVSLAAPGCCLFVRLYYSNDRYSITPRLPKYKAAQQTKLYNQQYVDTKQTEAKEHLLTVARLVATQWVATCPAASHGRTQPSVAANASKLHAEQGANRQTHPP